MNFTTDQLFSCPFCNLYCQDLKAPSPGSDKPAWQPGCLLAKASFDRLPEATSLPQHAGAPLDWDEALRQAHRLVQAARMPLVLLSGEASCEAQRAGVELARRLHARTDTPLSHFDFALPFAAIDPGYVTCTLGEAAHNADSVLLWGCRPEESHPRLLERLGRTDGRNTFTVNYGDRSPASNALWLKPGETIPFIEQLRLLARGEKPSGSLPALASLVDFLTSAQYGVLFYGEELLVEGRHAIAELFHLLDDLKGQGRWHAVYLSPAGNALGAAEALSRATGFAQTVRFTETGVEFVPQDGNAEEFLRHGATDLVIFVGRPAGLSKESMKHLEEIPSIMLSPTSPAYATLWLPVAQPGIHVDGTAIRLDGVMISLSEALSSDLPRMEDLLGRLAEEVRS
jgi:formylmethanofuran dehydrogenase subunit B